MGAEDEGRAGVCIGGREARVPEVRFGVWLVGYRGRRENWRDRESRVIILPSQRREALLAGGCLDFEPHETFWDRDISNERIMETKVRA